MLENGVVLVEINKRNMRKRDLGFGLVLRMETSSSLAPL
jgi:hypothetical protein